MINQNILLLIQRYRSEGYSIDKIKDFLLKSFPQRDVDEVINYVMSYQGPANVQNTNIHHIKISKTFIIISLIITIVLVAYGLGLFDREPGNTPIRTVVLEQNDTSIPNTDSYDEGSFGSAINNISSQNDCDQLSNNEQRYVCYTELSIKNNKFYCQNILDQNFKDNCYLEVLKNGNSGVCEYMVKQNFKDFCLQVRIVEQMNEAYRSNDTARVLELNKYFKPDIYNDIPDSMDFKRIYGQDLS